MAAPTFLETLTREVGRMQAAHPDREADVARACALIRLGMVTPSVEDPTEGRVLSSDGTQVYRVNGTCSCPSGLHGKGCKHANAWRLYQHIAHKVEAVPEVFDAGVKNPPLPEAPVSITLKASLHGYEALVTLRGTDFASVQAQVEQAAQWLKAQAPPHGQKQGEGWCSLHNVPMKLNHGKDGKPGWYSHKTPDGQWCKGK